MTSQNSTPSTCWEREKRHSCSLQEQIIHGVPLPNGPMRSIPDANGPWLRKVPPLPGPAGRRTAVIFPATHMPPQCLINHPTLLIIFMVKVTWATAGAAMQQDHGLLRYKCIKAPHPIHSCVTRLWPSVMLQIASTYFIFCLCHIYFHAFFFALRQ